MVELRRLKAMGSTPVRFPTIIFLNAFTEQAVCYSWTLQDNARSTIVNMKLSDWGMIVHDSGILCILVPMRGQS